MIEPRGSSSGLRPVHGLVVAGVVIVAALVAYAAFSFVVGTLWFIVKLAVVVAVFYGATKFVLRHARK